MKNSALLLTHYLICIQDLLQLSSILATIFIQAAKQAKRKRNITKADIGSPQDFKHLSHVGWNPDSGFDLDGVNDQLRKFFAKVKLEEFFSSIELFSPQYYI